MVMSSVRTSYCSHSSYASFTTDLQASRGSACALTRSATIWFVRNSNTPSDAMTTNLSRGVTWCSTISGSAFTPSSSAMASPMERVKAVPGYSPWGDQMRGGSPPSSSSSPRRTSPQFSWIGSRPSIWSMLRTLAPYVLTLSRSSFLYGVWS